MNTKYVAKDTIGYLVDSNWKPMLKTLEQWQRYANREAKKANKRDFKNNKQFWHGVVFIGQEYVRINIVG